MKHKNREEREGKVELVYLEASPDTTAESGQPPEREADSGIHRVDHSFAICFGGWLKCPCPWHALALSVTDMTDKMSIIDGGKREGVQIKVDRESEPLGNEKPADRCDEKSSRAPCTNRRRSEIQRFPYF